MNYLRIAFPCLLGICQLSIMPQETLIKKDTQIFPMTEAYNKDLGKNATLSSEEINEGTKLLRRYIPILFGEELAELPYYIYPRKTAPDVHACDLVGAWSCFFESLCEYRKSGLQKDKTTLKKEVYKIRAATKAIWQETPFSTDEQRLLLEYAPYCATEELEELKKRTNILQKKTLSLFEINQLQGTPKEQPANLYGRALMENISAMLQKTEQNLSLEPAKSFFNGPHLWLIDILKKADEAENLLKFLGLAALQETFLPEMLQNVLIRLCEEQDLAGLQKLFSGSSYLLEMKNKKGKNLMQVAEASGNIAAQEALKSFKFGSRYKYRYNQALTTES